MSLTPWRNEARATFALAWPLVLTNLAQIGISTTDIVMMGWLGPAELAAGTLGANLFLAFFIFGMGLGQGVSPLMAQALGAKRHNVRDVRRSVRQGGWAMVAVVVPCWLGLWQAEAIFALLGQDETLGAMAGAYVRAAQWGLLPVLLFMVLRSFISALERPQAALWVTVAAIAFNGFSNWLLMFGNWGFPALGLVGAGWSSTLASLFLCLALLAFVLWDRRLRRYHLLGRLWRPDWERFREIWRVGTPIGLALTFEIAVFNSAVFLVGLIDMPSLAAHGIAIQIASISIMVPIGLSQAATVRVGLAMGRLAAGKGERAQVAQAGWTALAMGMVVTLGAAALMILMPETLIGLFLQNPDEASARVMELGIVFLTIAGLFQVSDGAQTIAAGVLRGLKDTRLPMIFAGTGYWLIGLPFGAALAFPGGFGGAGIWIGLATGLTLVAALMLSRWLRRERLGLV